MYLRFTLVDCAPSPQQAGAEPFLFSLLGRMELDLAMATSSLNCLQLDQSLRAHVAEALVPTSKIKVIAFTIDTVQRFIRPLC